jgi:predicted DNA-binding protein
MTMTLKVQISVRIAIETLKALDTYCERTGASKAETVDRALREFFEREGVKPQ